MHRKYLIFFVFLFLTKLLDGQIINFKIITQDAINFWQAVDSLKQGKDTTHIFQTIVIDRATDEFNLFIAKWKIKASDYTYQIKHYSNFYKTLRKYTTSLLNLQDSIRETVLQFKSLYPNFKMADICIAFGNFRTGGNISTEGKKNIIYIGLEYHGLDSNTIINELPISTQDYVSRSNFLRTIIHEIVHVQQYTHGKKITKELNGNLLVNRVLTEGIPDFIAKLIVAGGNNGNYYTYGIKNENTLKLKIKKELWSEGNGNWFGGNDSLFIKVPRDLGYFMGLRIGQSFYNSQNPKNGNLTDLIEIKNLVKFIHESRYFDVL